MFKEYYMGNRERDRKENLFTTPQYTTAEEIKKIRTQLKLTQKEFASLINCSKPTVERWERSKTVITGPVVFILSMLEKYPEYVKEIRIPERTTLLRLWYMYKQKVCTIIDVDEMNQRVKITNFTNSVIMRAFGAEEHPDYSAYVEFLESRCFPRSRDKIKLVLRDLELPFYDPLMIIEKTEGRMAEDDFWIKIERQYNDRII